MRMEAVTGAAKCTGPDRAPGYCGVPGRPGALRPGGPRMGPGGWRPGRPARPACPQAAGRCSGHAARRAASGRKRRKTTSSGQAAGPSGPGPRTGCGGPTPRTPGAASAAGATASAWRTALRAGGSRARSTSTPRGALQPTRSQGWPPRRSRTAPGRGRRTGNGGRCAGRGFRRAVRAPGIGRHGFIRRSTPGQNGHAESFHKTLKREYVWPHESANYRESERIIAEAIADYNPIHGGDIALPAGGRGSLQKPLPTTTGRMHPSIGYMTPAESAELWEMANK